MGLLLCYHLRHFAFVLLFFQLFNFSFPEYGWALSSLWESEVPGFQFQLLHIGPSSILHLSYQTWTNQFSVHLLQSDSLCFLQSFGRSTEHLQLFNPPHPCTAHRKDEVFPVTLPVHSEERFFLFLYLWFLLFY